MPERTEQHLQGSCAHLLHSGTINTEGEKCVAMVWDKCPLGFQKLASE